jgi:hypothetical protein
MSRQTNLASVQPPSQASSELRRLALVVKKRILHGVSDPSTTGAARKRSAKAEPITSVLRALPDIEREVVRLFYFNELRPREIAASLDLSEDQVRKIKASATRKIRLAFELGEPKLHPLSKQYAPLIAHAVSVFGDRRKAAHWLDTPLRLLRGRSPAQVLAQDGDVATVDRILTRIEHNIPS